MTSSKSEIDRRDFLTGRVLPAAEGGARAPERLLYIASAVVTARPENCAAVAARIAEIPGAEVHGIEGSKIVVVLESERSGEIGGRLTEMALMDGVFSANLVFEQIEQLNDYGGGR
jgi:nitrate reductase NapD